MTENTQTPCCYDCGLPFVVDGKWRICPDCKFREPPEAWLSGDQQINGFDETVIVENDAMAMVKLSDLADLINDLGEERRKNAELRFKTIPGEKAG